MAKQKKLNADGPGDSDNDFPKKWKDKLPEGYHDAAQAKSDEELKEDIIKARRAILDINEDMELDAKLHELKEDLKALSGGYKEVEAKEEAKSRYATWLLKQRGGKA